MAIRHIILAAVGASTLGLASPGQAQDLQERLGRAWEGFQGSTGQGQRDPRDAPRTDPRQDPRLDPRMGQPYPDGDPRDRRAVETGRDPRDPRATDGSRDYPRDRMRTDDDAERRLDARQRQLDEERMRLDAERRRNR